MANTSEYKCLRCSSLFAARTADRKRGWDRFCSKSCKAVVQEKQTGQYATMKDRYNQEDDIGHPMSSGYFGHGQL